MHLFRAWFCGVFIGYALGDEVWLLIVGEVGVIGILSNFLSACLSPYSLRMSDASCGVGAKWTVHS